MFKLLSVLAYVRIAEFMLLLILSFTLKIPEVVAALELITAVVLILTAIFTKFFTSTQTLLFTLTLMLLSFDIYALTKVTQKMEISLTIYSITCMNILIDFVLLLIGIELMHR